MPATKNSPLAEALELSANVFYAGTSANNHPVILMDGTFWMHNSTTDTATRLNHEDADVMRPHLRFLTQYGVSAGELRPLTESAREPVLGHWNMAYGLRTVLGHGRQTGEEQPEAVGLVQRITSHETSAIMLVGTQKIAYIFPVYKNEKGELVPRPNENLNLDDTLSAELAESLTLIRDNPPERVIFCGLTNNNDSVIRLWPDAVLLHSMPAAEAAEVRKTVDGLQGSKLIKDAWHTLQGVSQLKFLIAQLRYADAKEHCEFYGLDYESAVRDILGLPSDD